MKKLKYYLVLVIMATLTVSCNKDEIETIETVQNASVMEFDNQNEMEGKIQEIIEFKKNQNADIFEKILLHNNLTKPTPEDLIKSAESDSKPLLIDENILLENAKFYHTERLNAIYELRERFNFTSLQSIVDEIESLKLLDPLKAKALSNKYSDFLVKTDFTTVSIYDKDMSEILNESGEVLVNKENLKLKNSFSEKFAPPVLVEGVVVTSNPIIGMTYHTGILPDLSNQYFTQYGLYLIINGIPILYPSLVVGPDSSVYYKNATTGFGKGRTIYFPTGIFDDTMRIYSGPLAELNGTDKYEPRYGEISVVITTVLEGTFVNSYGAAFF